MWIIEYFYNNQWWYYDQVDGIGAANTCKAAAEREHNGCPVRVRYYRERADIDG